VPCNRSLGNGGRALPRLTRVYNVVDRLHREVPRHELQDGPQAVQCRAARKPSHAHLCDGCVDDAAAAPLRVQTLGDLVRSVVLCHLLAHDEHRRIALHLLVEGGADCFTDSHLGGRRNGPHETSCRSTRARDGGREACSVRTGWGESAGEGGFGQRRSHIDGRGRNTRTQP
jgi:hypothetical protein